MTRDELLDWLALYEVDPWGPGREDMRAAVTSLWNRGQTFDRLKIQYPHVDDPETSELRDLETIEAIEAAKAARSENVN